MSNVPTENTTNKPSVPFLAKWNANSGSHLGAQADEESSLAPPPQQREVGYGTPALNSWMRPDAQANHPSVEALGAELVENAQRGEYRSKGVVAAFTAVFISYVLVAVPIALSSLDGWSISAAFYFSVQTAVGIGFGGIDILLGSTVQDIILLFHLLLGSLFVVILVAFLLASALDEIELRKDELSPLSLDVGRQRDLRCPAGLVISASMLMLFVIGLVVYGMLWENFSTSKALLFAISSYQTSGLIAPTVGSDDGAWPSLFISICVLFGVPIYAYTIGSAASYMAQNIRSRRRMLDVVERERRAEDVLRRRYETAEQKSLPKRGLRRQVSMGGTERAFVSRAGFLELWLLRNNLVDESTLAMMDAEFDELQQNGKADLEHVHLRLRFLQLVALKKLEPSVWEEINCEWRGRASVVEGSISRPVSLSSWLG